MYVIWTRRTHVSCFPVVVPTKVIYMFELHSGFHVVIAAFTFYDGENNPLLRGSCSGFVVNGKDPRMMRKRMMMKLRSLLFSSP